MRMIETRYGPGNSSGSNEKVGGRRLPSMMVRLCGALRERTKLPWVAAAAIFGIGLLTKPASAQAPAAERWNFQGGPSAGVLIGPQSALPELGFRFGASRGNQVLDLRVSAILMGFQKYGYLPPEWKWRGFEALVGLGWQPGLFGLGVRSGLMTAPTKYTYERWLGYVVEPHTALAIPLGSSFELRGDAGVQLVVPTNRQSLPGYIGTIRVGVERRLR